MFFGAFDVELSSNQNLIVSFYWSFIYLLSENEIWFTIVIQYNNRIYSKKRENLIILFIYNIILIKLFIFNIYLIHLFFISLNFFNDFFQMCSIFF